MRVAVTAGLLFALIPGQAAAQAGGLEVKGSVLSYLSRRAATLEQQVGRSSGTMTGLELAAGWRLISATARVSGGSFSADAGEEAVGEVSRAEIDLNAGPRKTTDFRRDQGSDRAHGHREPLASSEDPG